MDTMNTTYSWPYNTSSVNNSRDANMNGMAEEQPRAPNYIVVTATVFYVMIFIVGMIGNVIVITVISFSRQMKTAVNIYLVNLCVADLLVLVVCMPTALAEIFTMEAWYFGSFMCKLVPFFENTVANASVLTILAISIERYRVVCEPLKAIEEDFTKVAKIVAAIWIISALASTPCLFIAVYRSSHLVDGTPIMVCRNPIVKSWQRIYIVLLSLLFFGVPCLVLFVLNIVLCCTLLKSRSNDGHFACLQGRSGYTNRKRLQNQVMNIITSIVVIFFVCHLPLRVVGLWFTLEDKQVIFSLGLEKYLNILFSTRIMFYMNHALNPIVYNFVSTKFRSALRLLCSKHRRGNSFVTTDTKRKNISSLLGNHSTKRRKVLQDTRRSLDQSRPSFRKSSENVNISYNSSDRASSTSKDFDVKIKVSDKRFAIEFHVNKTGKSNA